MGGVSDKGEENTLRLDVARQQRKGTGRPPQQQQKKEEEEKEEEEEEEGVPKRERRRTSFATEAFGEFRMYWLYRQFLSVARFL